MSGIGNSAAFTRSGTPVVINGAGVHTLEYVSRALVVTADGGDTTVAFDGDATVFTVKSGQTTRIEARCLKFTTTANASVIVELTDISSRSLSEDALQITRADLVTTA